MLLHLPLSNCATSSGLDSHNELFIAFSVNPWILPNIAVAVNCTWDRSVVERVGQGDGCRSRCLATNPVPNVMLVAGVMQIIREAGSGYIRPTYLLFLDRETPHLRGV
jgi:hypothetical protein